MRDETEQLYLRAFARADRVGVLGRFGCVVDLREIQFAGDRVLGTGRGSW
jgi:hypothetical protein